MRGLRLHRRSRVSGLMRRRMRSRRRHLRRLVCGRGGCLRLRRCARCGRMLLGCSGRCCPTLRLRGLGGLLRMRRLRRGLRGLCMLDRRHRRVLRLCCGRRLPVRRR